MDNTFDLDIHDQFESIIKLIESTNEDLLKPRKISKRRAPVTSNLTISRRTPRKSTKTIWYLKELVKLKNEAEKQEKSGKFEKVIYKKINKALYIVQQTRAHLCKKGVEKVTRIVRRILGEYIEELVAESLQNRLMFMTTKSTGYQVNHKAIVEATKRLIEIYEGIPEAGNF